MSTQIESAEIAGDVACLDAIKCLAVLASGGVDSAILIGEGIERGIVVHPLYVRSGHPWENAEEAIVGKFLKRIDSPFLRPLVTLTMPITDLYREHWSMQPMTAPPAGTPDEDV